MPAAYTTTVSSFTFSTAKPTGSDSSTEKPTSNNTNPPPSAMVINDLYKVYLHTTPEDHRSSFLIVAKESSALWTILLLINDNLYIKSIINHGSQAIAMLEAACHVLVLIYHPYIKLHMQSINIKVDEILGLAQNVLMLIGAIMLYVQIHIVCNPAYNILLGRPFNIVLESVVHEFSNEDQMITIHNPNTSKTATVLTFMHRTHPCTAHPSPDFCNLWI